MMALVRALAAVLLCQLDPLPLQSVHGADVNTVSPDHFHMLPNCACIRHVPSPVCGGRSLALRPRSDSHPHSAITSIVWSSFLSSEPYWAKAGAGAGLIAPH